MQTGRPVTAYHSARDRGMVSKIDGLTTCKYASTTSPSRVRYAEPLGAYRTEVTLVMRLSRGGHQ